MLIILPICPLETKQVKEGQLLLIPTALFLRLLEVLLLFIIGMKKL